MTVTRKRKHYGEKQEYLAREIQGAGQGWGRGKEAEKKVRKCESFIFHILYTTKVE